MSRAIPRFLRRVRRAPSLTLALCAALLVAAVFAVRLAHGALGWHSAAGDNAIAGWMTPRYVARSQDVPPEVLAETLGLDRDGSGRQITLQAMAEERGIPPSVLIDTLQAAIDAHRAARP